MCQLLLPTSVEAASAKSRRSIEGAGQHLRALGRRSSAESVAVSLLVGLQCCELSSPCSWNLDLYVGPAYLGCSNRS
jgi:hypothetical protein